MVRSVAEERPNPPRRASVSEATGSPLSTYSRTSAASTRRDRSDGEDDSSLAVTELEC